MTQTKEVNPFTNVEDPSIQETPTQKRYEELDAISI